ncbi:MAG: cellulose binding domain-containing protein, partial [Lachnospiraceae bacterium]|nr:cellulose binding domain-containing protein [Lachnospiraceae bacterium]
EEPEADSSRIYDVTKNNREEEIRRGRKVGYYDVAALYKATTTASRKSPVIDHVEVHNEETLYLTYEITKEPQAVNQLTYKVSLLDADKGNKPELVIEIDGTKIKGRNIGLDGDLLPLSGSMEKYTVPCKVTRYDLACETGSTEVRRASESSSASVSSGVVMDSVPVIVWSEGTDSAGNYITTGSTTVPRIHVLLDMADLNATQDKYAAYSKGIRDFYKDKRFGSSGDNSLSQDANIEDNSFTGTQSFFRFGLAPDDVFAKVEGSSTSKYKSPAPANNIDTWGRNLENTGFAESSEAAEGEEGKKRITYSVTKSRHLYNMRYIEALDYESQDIVLITTGPAAQLGYAPIAGVDYTIVRDSDNNGDIAWDKSIEKQLADKADQPLRAVSDNSIYPACERLRVNDTLFGGGNTISGLKVINEKVVEENKYTAFNPTGFINRNYGTVRDLTLDRTEVSGGDFTGGFFGVNACEATNLTMTDTCKVEGRKYVGGIAGIVLPSGNHVDHSKDTDIKKACNIYNMKTDEKQELENAEVIYKVTNYAKVSGSQSIGGISGAIRNDYAFIKDLYTGSGEGGTMTDDELKKSFPGLYNIEDGSAVTEGNESVVFLISECTNYGPVSCVANDASGIGSDMTAFSGGIAGYVFDQYKTDKEKLHIVIDNCNGAPMYDDEIIKGSGGIFSSVDVFKAKATGNYVGGIAGYNYGAQISNCYSEAKDNGSSYVIGKNYVGGITGLNLGYLGGDVEAKNIKNGKITKASEKAVPGVNNNIVAGDSYVGGVTGSNSDYIYSYTDNTDSGEEGSAVIKTKPIESFDPEAIILARSEDNTISIVPKRDINLHNRVTGFINRTQVYNSGKYGGGVAGYNTGYLLNNNSIYRAAGSDDLFASTAEGNNKDYTGSYIGAIAGYNNGIMGNTVRTIADDGRTSTVTAPDVKAEAISAGCFIRGNNFLGGIVGYNDSDSTIEDYNVTQGGLYGNADSSFVGGYAGFNSAPGLLMDLSADNTEDEEGSISYNGSHTIYSNIDPIIGGYFVGGDIGGNILNKKENPKINNIGVVVRSDGFFRRLTGKEFVGGYIGYNLIINNSNEDLKADDINYANKNASMIVADYLLSSIDRTERDAKEKFKVNNDVVDNLSTGLKGISFYDTSDPTSYMRLYIKGQKGNAVSAMSRITGQLHVGGVIGYNDDNSMLYIEDVENATPIYAENCIENPDERTISRLVGELRVIDDGTKDYTGEVPKKAFVYSYGGGIIGRVGARTTLKNCRNAQQGLINTKGTYLGGLCEVNDGGKLISCNVSNLGYSDHDYLGGLCGLNKGVIEKCTIDGMTITGRNVVGGLTAENLGVLKNNSINNTHIRALGLDITNENKETEKHGVAGTYAGVNGASGEIVLSANRLPGSTYDIENIDVVSSGKYVGGIVGVNKGFINNDKDGFKLLYTDDYSGYSDDDMKTWLSFSGTIRGESYVGGLVGKNDIDIQGKEEAVALKYMLKGFDNYAGVIADNGTAGGIIGQTTGKSNISFCANHGDVSAPLKGNSGGIIAENSGVISFCRDFAAVSAVNGMSGGIAAINKPEGEIRNIRVEGPEENDEEGNKSYKVITFESKEATGAIAAINEGKISGVNIHHVNVTNEKGYERAYIGAVVGENIFPSGYSFDSDMENYGYINLDSTSMSDCSVIARSNYTNAGGIAGENKGLIRGKSASQKAVIVPVISMQGSDRAVIGGVSGTNSGIIEYISVDGNIIGGKGSDNIGYGGISGINTTGLYSNTGSIRYCTFDGSINTSGNASSPASTGGIVGINRSGAIVQYCGLGVDTDSVNNTNNTLISSGDQERDFHDPDKSAYAYLGGIVGDNYGIVRDIDMMEIGDTTDTDSQISKDNIKIKGFNGTAGGIIGINRAGGTITGTEGKYLRTTNRLSVEMHGSETGSGAGGIIGIDYTGGPFEYMESNASVQARYDVDVRAGGIIANCQPYDSRRVIMNKIINRGSVTGYEAAGGLIGELMYAGFSFTGCENYGEIRSEHGDAGGLLGCGEMLNTNCSFTDCINHGHVYVPQFAWDDSRSNLNESTDEATGGEAGETWDGVKRSKTYNLPGSIQVKFDITDGPWEGSGTKYNAQITIINNSTDLIDNWAVAMDYRHKINLWEQATLAGKNGDIYKIKCKSYNADIQPNGGTVTFGLTGLDDFVEFPASFTMLGVMEEREIKEYSAWYEPQDEWNGGFNGNIYIKNTSDVTIEDWTVSFALNREINPNTIANADFISHTGNRYVFKNKDNQNNFIEPNGEVSIFIAGTGGTAQDTPYDFVLMSYDPVASQTSAEHYHNGAGGMLGSYRETNGVEEIYLYNCVNTGVIQRVWEKGAKPDKDNIAENIGAFVGKGDSSINGKSCYWYFDTCRNYNPIADTTEGFIGTCDDTDGEYYVNCLDDSNLITTKRNYTPFLTHTGEGDVVKMSNCYYLNGAYDTDSYDTYFTFSKVVAGNLYYTDMDLSSDVEFDAIRSPELFLMTPDNRAAIRSSSNISSLLLEFDIVNGSKSPGMDSFNVYLWSGHNSENSTVYNYRITALFVDENGSAEETTGTGIGNWVMKDSEVSLKVPASLSKKIQRVFLKIEPTNKSKVYLRGFTWSPVNKEREARCTPMSEAGDTQFSISSIKVEGLSSSKPQISLVEPASFLIRILKTLFSWFSSLIDYIDSFFGGSGSLNVHYITGSYYDTLLGIKWQQYESYKIRKSNSNGKTVTISFDVNNREYSKGMEKFVFYPRSNAQQEGVSFTYHYKVRFYGSDNNAPVEVSGVTDRLNNDTSLSECREVIIVPSDVKGKVTKIDLIIGNVNYYTLGIPNLLDPYADGAYFSGFGWIPNGESQEYLMAPTTSYQGWAVENSKSSTMSTKLAVDYRDDTPYIHTMYDYDIGFKMYANEDPIGDTYLNDATDYSVSSKQAIGSDSRIRVYEAMEVIPNDSYKDTDYGFLSFIKKTYTNKNKLTTPTGLKLTRENGNSALTLSWDRVMDAFGYEVSYRIRDDEAYTTIVSSEGYDDLTEEEKENKKNSCYIESHGPVSLGSEITSYTVANRSEWNDPSHSYSIVFEVMAVNANSSENNSDTAVLDEKISVRVLAAPKVHLELTDDNNMAAVLDNRDDYAIRDESGNITGYIDCEVKVTYNGRGVREDRKEEYTIPVKDSRFSTQSMWVELDDEQDSTKAQIIAIAKPSESVEDDYIASQEVVSAGHLADNEELWNGDSSNDDEEYVKYKGMTYIPYGYKKRLRGFKGDDVENMKYLVQYKHFDDKNAWMRSDISEYDEDLEMWVAVTSNEAHIGAEGGHTSYNTYLENIPKEWFSEDNPTQLLVRNYLSRSENDIVLYGHDVATGIKLNGGSAEANKEILKQIKDPYHLTIDWDTTTREMEEQETYNIKVEENASIWDDSKNTLKDGYVLVRDYGYDGDGTEENAQKEPVYSIYYNSTLYLAKKYNTDEYKKDEETGVIAKDRYGNDYEY